VSAQFLFWEYLFRIFANVSWQCRVSIQYPIVRMFLKLTDILESLIFFYKKGFVRKVLLKTNVRSLYTYVTKENKLSLHVHNVFKKPSSRHGKNSSHPRRSLDHLLRLLVHLHLLLLGSAELLLLPLRRGLPGQGQPRPLGQNPP
jgi:hypothetical protein